MRQAKKSSAGGNHIVASAFSFVNRTGTRTSGSKTMSGARMQMKDQKAGPRSSMHSATQGKSARLGRDVQSKIGQQLRAIYDDVVSQGVPDRFVDLLSRLDDKQADKG